MRVQELYVRRGLTPKYDLVQIEGAVHEPTFKYRVTIGEFVATGCGQSKKKAKHSAAKVRARAGLLMIMISNISSLGHTGQTERSSRLGERSCWTTGHSRSGLENPLPVRRWHPGKPSWNSAGDVYVQAVAATCVRAEP